MPLRTEQLNSQKKEFVWEYLGEEVHLAYNPQGFTPELEVQLAEGTRQGEGLIRLLRSFLVDWDLVEDTPEKEDENGNPVPEADGTILYKVDAEGNHIERPLGISEAKMMRLPIVFISDCIDAIVQDIRAVSEEGKRSDAGSLQVVS